MKELLILLMLSTSVSYAAKWRVAFSGGNFSNIQAAHDASATGDTIYVEALNTTGDYGNLKLTKKLYILGPGYFLNENYPTLINLNTGNIGSLNIHSSAAGSVVTGIKIIQNIYIYSQNITIDKNYIAANVFLSGDSLVHNCIISRNFIAYNVGTAAYNFATRKFSDGIFIKNNIVTFVGFDQVHQVVIENNTVLSTNATYAIGSVVRNNIFYASFKKEITTPYTTYQNNICAGADSGFGGTNVFNANMSNVLLLSGSSDAQYMLKTGSQAKGAGIGGVDCGAFGGITPYIISGIPSIPVIYKLDVPLQSNGNSLNVTISTRSNP